MAPFLFKLVVASFRSVLGLAALVAIAGCSASQTTTASNVPDQFEVNTLWLSGQCLMLAEAADVLRSSDSGARVSAPDAVDDVFVIRGTTHWTSFWQSVHSSTIDPPAVPPVDFEKHSLVAVVLDRQSRAGGAVELADSVAALVDSESEGLLVEIPVRIRMPEPGGMSAAVVTRPCIVVQTYPALPDSAAVRIVSDSSSN